MERPVRADIGVRSASVASVDFPPMRWRGPRYYQEVSAKGGGTADQLK
jgi:hypothetical protein